MLRNKKFQLILSLLVAIALWLYVVGDVNPTIEAVISDIEVETVGDDTLEELGLKATLDGPKTVDITISGPRTAVNEAKKETFRATVDVSNCDYGDNEGEINIVYPEDVSGVSISDMSAETVRFTVE